MSTVPNDRPVPVPARELAARLSALFERDIEIVTRLADAQHRLQHANERLLSGLTPNAFALINDSATTGTGPIATLTGDSEPPANSATLDALQHLHWTIHRAFCRYEYACEERRQLAVEVGELSHQLTDALCAAGWSMEAARQANVHQLARAAAA